MIIHINIIAISYYIDSLLKFWMIFYHPMVITQVSEEEAAKDLAFFYQQKQGFNEYWMDNLMDGKWIKKWMFDG